MKFTDRGIAVLKHKSERYEVWENGRTGFGLRVGRKRKTWIFVYRFYGKPRRMTLGVYPKVSLADAHEAHGIAERKLAEGKDPGRESVQKNITERNAETVSDLVELYLEKWAKPRKKSWREDERMLRKDIVPRWGYIKAKDIMRKDVRAMLSALTDRGCTITANRTFAVTRKMFNWALSQDIIESSPCAGIPAPVKENRRDRVMSPSEIKKFWTGLDKAKMTTSLKLALKLILVTAQRKGEVNNAEWSEIDLKEGLWNIPAEKSKNGLAHRVPLSLLAITLFEEVKLLAGNSRWAFPSLRNNNAPIGPTALDHALYRNLDIIGIDNLTPHDLRRTAASMIASIGTPRLVLSKILNHVDSSVTAIYDRHSYDNDKRVALNAWAKELETIVKQKSESKIIPLRISGERQNADSVALVAQN